MCRYLSREMQRSVAVSWRLLWSSGGFALSFPPSSLPTQRPVSWCFSTKTSWHRCPSTAPMSFSCCSLRLVHVQVEWRNGMYTPQATCQLQCPLLSLFPCSLICLSGWMKPIPCFRREHVCWNWSMELSASAAETPSLSFSRLFTFSPNTGPGFYGIISPTITAIAFASSWPVSWSVLKW